MNWISVEDRLPEEIMFGISEYILFFAQQEGKVFYGDYWVNQKKWHAHGIDDIEYERHEVTHWMPIPCLPEKKNEY